MIACAKANSFTHFSALVAHALVRAASTLVSTPVALGHALRTLAPIT
jgi:hypothetical protein